MKFNLKDFQDNDLVEKSSLVVGGTRTAVITGCKDGSTSNDGAENDDMSMCVIGQRAL